jgi:hypothetical protein
MKNIKSCGDVKSKLNLTPIGPSANLVLFITSQVMGVGFLLWRMYEML